MARQSRPYDYRSVPAHLLQEECESTNCKFPETPRKTSRRRWRYLLSGIIWTAGLVQLSFLVVSVVYTVLFATRPHSTDTSLDPDSLEFALYKNSRFYECYEKTNFPVNLNCTAVQAALNTTAGDYHGVGHISTNQILRGDNADGTGDWCDVISCINDYKVIPSTPRDSAIWPTLLTVWTQAAFFFIGSLYQFEKRHRALYKAESKRCKALRELNPLDWFFHAHDLASTVWWWVTFAQLAAAPDRASAPFLIGWVIPWKYGGLLAYHPYSCGQDLRKIKIARWTLYILALAQWCAMFYVIHVNFHMTFDTNVGYGYRGPSPSYDCVAEHVLAGPGTTTCSADQLCAFNWLYVDTGFTYTTDNNNFNIGIGVLDLGLTIAAAVPLLMLPISLCFSSSKDRSIRQALEDSHWANRGPVLALAVCSFYGIIVGAMLVAELVKRYGAAADAVVTVYWECRAVHVALSGYRYYLDMQIERGLRIAKMWFNS
ncbi:hypothetical protein BDW71DRAFT_208120 [Aspergillus fruticulosus]